MTFVTLPNEGIAVASSAEITFGRVVKPVEPHYLLMMMMMLDIWAIVC
jgi:hypothetical protein